MVSGRRLRETEEHLTGELFRSENPLVRHRPAGGTVRVATFGSYTNSPGLNREGFGETYLAGRRIDAIHVVNRDNRWYQYPETADALATVAKATAAYDRTLTYGSSMGG